MKRKARCFKCKKYDLSGNLMRTNIGFVHKDCLNKTKHTAPYDFSRKTTTGKGRKAKGLKRKYKPKSLKKQCDDLWIECIKARAGYKSEISGKKGRQIGGEHILGSHHIFGKPNYRLRYDLDNGICLTNGGEHKFGVHNQGRKEAFEKEIRKVKGKKIMEKLENISKYKTGGIDLKMIKIYLEQKLSEFKREKAS